VVTTEQMQCALRKLGCQLGGRDNRLAAFKVADDIVITLYLARCVDGVQPDFVWHKTRLSLKLTDSELHGLTTCRDDGNMLRDDVRTRLLGNGM
jgi:hypothetical protein